MIFRLKSADNNEILEAMWLIISGAVVERVNSRMLLCSEILQSIRHLDNLEKVFQGITTKLLNLVQNGHIAIYQLDEFIDNYNEMGISGKIVAEAIAPNCEPCSQEQIENILREEYQWGQDITKQIIDLYTSGVSRCEINFAEIFADKAYLLVPIVLSERMGDQPLWGFLILHQCLVLDGESLQGSWDQDDALMLQQIAMQIEIILHGEIKTNLIEQAKASEQAYATLSRSIDDPYRHLVEQVSNVFYVVTLTEGLEATYISPQLQELLGIPTLEWNTNFFKKWMEYIYPADYDLVQQEFQHTIETGELFCCEYRMITNNGAIIWIRDTAQLGFAADGKTKVLSGSLFDISDRKAIEQALQKSESLLAEAQRVAQLGNWEWNVSSNESTWSQELFRIFERDPALGPPTYEDVLLLYIAEDRETHAQAVQQAINTGESYHLDLRRQQSDGSYRHIEVFGHAEHDDNGKVSRLYGTAQDISDRKAIEQVLQKSEARLVEAQRVAKLGNWELDVLTKEVVWSAELFNIFDRDIALGVPTFEEAVAYYVLEDQQKMCQAIKRTMDTGESCYLELRLAHLDRYLETKGHAEFNDQGEIIRLYGTAQDISDRKLTEAKLIAAQIAEAENRSKGEFLAIMSHELRTPMNAVIGMTEILQRTALSYQQQQYVNTILQGGEVLLSVINNILDFSRIESGHFELEEKPFRLHQCIEEVLELMASRTTEKFIELIAFIQPDVPQQLIGDYTRLRQILVNLVGNAIKFTESGEIVIAVNSQLIDRETNTYELQFEVRDTGIGIAPEAIAKLFNAFSQADNSIAGQYGGTGLGLAICKQLCELMDGEIGVSSNVGEGSTFSFSIRVQAIIEDLDTTNAIAPELKGKRILSVNPNSTIQQAIALYAQPWEMNIQAAYTASEALQLLTTFDFEAVLIDRQLVEADGSKIDVLELAKSIQEIFPDLDLILLTPINVVLNENNYPTCFRDCITKPISTSKLYQVFLNVFSNQKDTTFPPQNPPLIPQPSCETDNIVGDENFAKCYPFQILIVEDNPVNQRILLLMLENLGYQADIVDNGKKAVNNFLSRPYDLIFMDIQMPIMGGLDATKSIRQTPNRQPRIIGLSANAFSESRDLALNAGMDDYLTKPLQIKSLIASLQRIPQQPNIVEHSQHPIDSSILASMEESVGSENLEELIDIYLEHATSTIAKMKEAFIKQDFATIAALNHDLKGGSGNFGAIQLSSSCQALQSICSELIKSNEYTNEDVTKIASLMNNVEEQYNDVYQILQSREFNH
jgi:signal transduction histidine kinase/CheY-like chemotaxis protein/HPt (histidine-containing phosphotransfer) domain-containing protein